MSSQPLGQYLARSREWLWRGDALSAASVDGPPAGTQVARQLDRAQAAFDVAARTARPRSGEDAAQTSDPQIADALSLSLYREAAHWALCAAAGGQGASDLSRAFAQLTPQAWASLALPAHVVEAAREGLLERDFVASAALDPEACARDAQAARVFVEALLYTLGAREERELRFLRQRVLRVSGVGALVLTSLLAIVVVPRALRPNLAEHAPWRVSSSALGYPASGQGGSSLQAQEATPGSSVSGETSLFFHTQKEASPWIELDLEQIRVLHRVRLVNRADCCWERAAPLAIELSHDRSHWREFARRDELFYDWSTSLDGQEARYLRVRALRPTMLHLTRVEIR